MNPDFKQELELHLRANYPIIFVVTLEEERATRIIAEAVTSVERTFIRPRPYGEIVSVPQQLSSAGPSDGVLLLDNVHRQMDDKDVIRLLADIQSSNNTRNRTAVILTPWIQIPPELERISAILELSLPTPEQLRGILDDVCAETGVLLVDDDAMAMVRVGQGLTGAEARRAFQKAMIGWPEEAQQARDSIERDKRRALHRSSVLEHVDVTENLGDVGGMDQLKQWLHSREKAFSEEAKAYGLPAPRGVLLMGIQGCGKSLSAKAVAGYWDLPLVRLDLSAVYGQAYPEAALRAAIQVAEAMAPVVLWIDEIEKGFDNISVGAASRLLGGMVTWLQEKKEEVFVVATANKVDALPPELPRKGRFDEIFFVDLPDAHERKAILELHLSKRGYAPSDYDVDALVKKTEKMTGSELEQMIIAAMYLAFERGEKPTDSDLRRVRMDTVTLYETYEQDIKKLREWARKRARSASTNRRKIDYFTT